MHVLQLISPILIHFQIIYSFNHLIQTDTIDLGEAVCPPEPNAVR